MGIEDLNQRKRHNVFGEFVDKPLGNGNSRTETEVHGQWKVKLHFNSEALLSKQLLTTLFQDSIQFQLFVTKSYSPPSTSTSAPPGELLAVYILKVTSASDSNDEGEVASNRVESGATTVVTETRLVADGQFLLRSRL